MKVWPKSSQVNTTGIIAYQLHKAVLVFIDALKMIITAPLTI